jgi:hypothetical protein
MHWEPSNEQQEQRQFELMDGDEFPLAGAGLDGMALLLLRASRLNFPCRGRPFDQHY